MNSRISMVASGRLPAPGANSLCSMKMETSIWIICSTTAIRRTMLWNRMTMWFRCDTRGTPFGMGADLTWAHGLGDRPAAFGITLLPTYVIAKNLLSKKDVLQAVLRYQFAASNKDNGLQLQQRYEQEIMSGGAGDHYHAIYGGINYLIFGDRLKLMTGVEYSTMHDSAHDGGAFNGWTYFAGVR